MSSAVDTITRRRATSWERMDMGFSIKLAPGLRIRASSQGLRTTVGPGLRGSILVPGEPVSQPGRALLVGWRGLGVSYLTHIF